jgi:hypothetical protein
LCLRGLGYLLFLRFRATTVARAVWFFVWMSARLTGFLGHNERNWFRRPFVLLIQPVPKICFGTKKAPAKHMPGPGNWGSATKRTMSAHEEACEPHGIAPGVTTPGPAMSRRKRRCDSLIRRPHVGRLILLSALPLGIKEIISSVAHGSPAFVN